MSISVSNFANCDNISKIVLATYNKQNISENIEQVILSPDISECVGFNDVLNNYPNAFVGCLSRHDNLINDKAIISIAHTIKKYPYINYIYSDRYIKRNDLLSKQFYPSVSPININSIILNTPIFIKTNLRFNEKLSTLYFYDMIKRLHQDFFGMHIAEFLFISDYQEQKDVEEELKIINGKYTK